MKKLLSLPQNLVQHFHNLEQLDSGEWFCTSDPAGHKIGSGGGTAWLLDECRRSEDPACAFSAWLPTEKRILLHAGGQSRRLPAYAPSGKILTPIPVFRWERGQNTGQNLLNLQLPLYEKIMKKAPGSLHTLIASGDVYIRSEKCLQNIPEADVVCYGLWTDLSLATHHGVFASRRETPDRLDFMMQKPSLQEMESLANTHFFLMDIGIWLLNDRAIDILYRRSFPKGDNIPVYYDLYSDFGPAMGDHPVLDDDEIQQLRIAVLPLPGGEFYHYGTNRELISSTLAIQNKVSDQRKVLHRKVKPHPAMFIQNAIVDVPLSAENSDLWIENSHISANWKLSSEHIITGVPENNWHIDLPEKICVDIIPHPDHRLIIRPYGIDDKFRGAAGTTAWMDQPVAAWLEARNLTPADIREGEKDIQSAGLFPAVYPEQAETVLRWMITEPDFSEGKQIWLESEKFSADEISNSADLPALYAQRSQFRKKNLLALSANYERSIFYHSDLACAAKEFTNGNLPAPDALPEDAALIQRMHNRMFRARCFDLQGKDSAFDRQEAFGLMREALLSEARTLEDIPRLNVLSDQIVWSRSPVRIDLAGGWTDTPPYSLYAGGNVVNIAINLNGQQPLQVYVKPSDELNITLRSIDMGASEVIKTYDELKQYNRIGSPFSIPKAALDLAGFHAESGYKNLQKQLEDFGSGIELTLLAAIPSGSGLGTSSLLASTVLGALNDFCGLNWDKNNICLRTLALEQLLTTGGGWQDQYGGVIQGVKLLQTEPGLMQNPSVRWLPDYLFTQAEYKNCHLLYYTGITRTAKHILGEIVEAMFLNSEPHLRLLSEMKDHALNMAETIQRGNFEEFGRLTGYTWEQNKALDKGTNPPAIEELILKIRDLALGYKLPGAGGGGYLYIIAKDNQAALRIREILTRNAPNKQARFVEMSLSEKGLQTSRS